MTPRKKKIEQDLDCVFNYIVEYKLENDGNSPSVNDIQEYFEWPRNMAYRRLAELRRRKRIFYPDDKARSITVPGGQWSIKSLGKDW